METKEPEELIVISDLHLSDGYDETTGKYSRNEDFFFDEEFQRFLEHLQQEPPKKHLIINGDMFDFLQVDPNLKKFRGTGSPFILSKNEKNYGLGTEKHKTVWKLGEIAKGHELFFEALASFISGGNRLSIISGNHDIELYWEEVQDEFRKLIVASKPGGVTRQQVRDNINFYPWFYYDEKYKAYIEHGNQYDKFNSFEYFLYPHLEHESEQVWLPFGSYFVRYFFNKLETVHPFADNIKPISKYAQWAWSKDKLGLLKVIWKHIRMMFGIFKKRKEFSHIDKEKLNEENEGKLQRLKQNKPHFNNIDEIYHLMATPLTSGRLSILFFFAGTIFFVITVVALATLIIIRFFYALPSWTFLSALGFLLVPLFKRIYFKYFHKGFFEKNMTKIQKIKDNLSNVRIIVFGHTHDPDIRNVDNKFWYVNTGTWTTVFSEEERIIREAKQFAFVWIKDASKKPELLQWNPNLNNHQQLKLLEPKRKKTEQR